VSWRDRVSRLRLDTTPLRESRDFRLLTFGGTVFYLGGMVSYVAVPYQLYHLTGSNFAVGALGIVELLPLVVFGLYGGALADHADRRVMLVTTGATQVVLTAVLLVNAFLPNPRVWLIYLVGGLLAAAQSLQRPSREALVPRTVRHDQLPAAMAVSSLGREGSVLLGPTVGGVLIQLVGVGWCYAVDVTGLVVAATLFALMRSYPATDRSNPPSLSGIMDGLRYAVSRRDLMGTYVVDIVAMVMAMPIVLFPALALHVFHTPAMLGLLYSAESIGGLIITATSGWTSRVHHHGRAVVLSAIVWGGAIGLVGLAPNVWWALVALVVAGAGDMVSGIFRGTIWNQTIPDSMRGRLAGIEMLSYSLGPLGGQARSGLVADAWSVRGAITSGGLLCVGGVALTAALLRGFWSYDARTDEFAVRERLLRRAAEETPPSPAPLRSDGGTSR
jgi:MFS family permease